MYLIQHFPEFCRIKSPVSSIILEIFVISHTFPQILDCSIRRLITDHFHIPFPLINPVLHPLLITIKIPKAFIAYGSFAHTVSADKAIRFVCHLQKTFTVALSKCQMEIRLDILSYCMIVEIIQMLLHLKRQLFFQKRFCQNTGIGRSPVKHCNILCFYPVLHDFFNLFGNIPALLCRIFNFLHMDHLLRFPSGTDRLLITSLIMFDHS